MKYPRETRSSPACSSHFEGLFAAKPSRESKKEENAALGQASPRAVAVVDGLGQAGRGPDRKPEPVDPWPLASLVLGLMVPFLACVSRF